MRWELRSLPPEEVEACKVALQSWQEPGAFCEVSAALRQRLSREEFFNIPALSFLREAWTLGRFATLSGAESVRLGEDRFPDGFVRTGGQVTEVEVTEAIMPDRRRGLEFLPGTPQIKEDPFEEWTRRLNALPAVLTQTILKKANKTYSGRPTLVAYLNITAYGHRDAEMIAAIGTVLAQFGERFGGLHALWQGQLFSSSPPALSIGGAAKGL